MSCAYGRVHVPRDVRREVPDRVQSSFSKSISCIPSAVGNNASGEDDDFSELLHS